MHNMDLRNVQYTEKELENNIDKFNNWDWNDISRYQTLSEEFIAKFQDKVYWDLISIYQKLSEQFIEKFQDKVYWNWISKDQKLSEAFLIKHLEKVGNVLHIEKSETIPENTKNKLIALWRLSNS